MPGIRTFTTPFRVTPSIGTLNLIAEGFYNGHERHMNRSTLQRGWERAASRDGVRSPRPFDNPEQRQRDMQILRDALQPRHTLIMRYRVLAGWTSIRDSVVERLEAIWEEQGWPGSYRDFNLHQGVSWDAERDAVVSPMLLTPVAATGSRYHGISTKLYPIEGLHEIRPVERAR